MCRGMVFWRYPLDQHVCLFTMSSYGYDQTQLQIQGQHSYHRSHQRDLQFFTDIRELDLSRRVWGGEESKFFYG